MMQPGDVIKANNITVLKGQPKLENYRETWKCKKHYRYVFLLLGIEEDGKFFDPASALRTLGWRPQTLPKERKLKEKK
jgi:hypothetical protein